MRGYVGCWTRANLDECVGCVVTEVVCVASGGSRSFVEDTWLIDSATEKVI